MPKQVQPWYRKGRGWYIEFNRKQIFLAKDRGDAFRAFYALMAGNELPKNSVSEIVDEFSKWVDNNRSPATAKWYKDTLQLFLAFRPGLSIDQLKPFHVQQWMDSAKVSQGTKRNYCRVMQRCMKWAEELGYIDYNPIRNMRKPPPTFRDVVIPEKEYKRILKEATTIKPLIQFAWETGARASEIVKIRWEQGKRPPGRWVIFWGGGGGGGGRGGGVGGRCGGGVR
jgi:integrase